MLRYGADRRTIAYLACTAVLTAINWRMGRVHPVLYPITLFMFFTSAVISHNHNHLGMWRSKALNLVTSYLIALFYGHHAIAWVPTHNQVHQHQTNRPGARHPSTEGYRTNTLA